MQRITPPARSWQPSCSCSRAPPTPRRASTGLAYDFAVRPVGLERLRRARATCSAGTAPPPAARTSRRTASWRAPAAGRRSGRRAAGSGRRSARARRSSAARSPTARACCTRSSIARVKMRGDGVGWDAAPTLVSEQQTTALTDHVLPLAGGFRQIGVALYAHPATAGAGDRRVGRLRDARPARRDGRRRVAAGTRVGRRRLALLDGAWHQGDVCATLSIADGRSRASAPSRSRAMASRPAGGARDRIRSTSRGSRAPSPVCASRVGHSRRRHPRGICERCGCERGTGGASCRSPSAWTGRPPSRGWVAPGATAADALPAVELDVGDATSGVTAVGLQIDGTPVALAVHCRASDRAPRGRLWPTARTR